MFDLLLKNAQVVDPLNGINDVCDVAVENGLIAADPISVPPHAK